MTVDHFACLKGNSQAWEALLIRYQRLIYSIPLRYGLTKHEADDIFQNVSLALLENLDRLHDHQRLGAWLVTTTRRECWRSHRKRQTISPSLGDERLEERIPSNLHTEEDFLALERQSIVRAAVDQLGGRCKALLDLLFYAEPRPSYADIAQKIKIPEGSIGPTRARCLEKMVKILEKMHFLGS